MSTIVSPPRLGAGGYGRRHLPLATYDATDTGEVLTDSVNAGLSFMRLYDAAEAVVEAAAEGSLDDVRGSIRRLRMVLERAA